jgi:NADH:ubiquinone oxidoreductase subunit 3 (subunit A)
MKKIVQSYFLASTSVIAISLFFFATKASASSTQVMQNQQESTDILATVVSLVLPAILGFVSAILLDLYKSSREKKKRLSYSTNTNPKVDTIKITETGGHVKYESDIALADFIVENTGNKILKGQYIRLASPEGTKILDVKYSPEPEREMEFKVNADNLKANEYACTIGYIKPKQKVGFHLLIENPQNSSITLSPHHKSSTDNDEDVIFDSGLKNKADDDKEIIRTFLVLVLIFIILPTPFNFPISTEFGFLFGFFRLEITIANIIQAFLLFFILNEIVPFSKAITNMIFKYVPE